ncbi:uncharacterized protein NDAI_0J01080 [Naumovozyma dairenensis CBS 421]|uniref:Uncharacterized protein n=1 Tax=Naumovozyma dairenensis (strain ATCC 10597 / BCRC 20456 / CBS 421 / NBRC 0211 / NRRL Y-12639) TaxID=1071378 RepID=G0WGS2_NAUDC|nr:hypothetical protein NDAI_0J01080 [Naumovozyma dairenensis CBS 421]CCD27000.1 hypothetical protein NDAI_0J01080 [Naumovozyma dairenensis CBS 421]
MSNLAVNLPLEVLEKIIDLDMDSCQTFLAWSQISTYFRDIIKTRIGIVLVKDGLVEPTAETFPLDFNVLLTNSNHFLIDSDIPLEESSTYDRFLSFMNQFHNILVIIQSDRSFSDSLASILGEIGRNSYIGATINIIYNSSVDFLSKLYFRELSLYQRALNLCELHVVGNRVPMQSETCDIDTLFKTTYIYNLKSLYSLDIKDDTHILIAPQLRHIRQISCSDTSTDLVQFLSKCTKLKYIEGTKFPLPFKNIRKYRMPFCQSMTLTNYNHSITYPIIDGSKVSTELILVPTLRAVDPEFSRLMFPNISRMVLKVTGFTRHVVDFKCCHFRNLKQLSIKGATIPWMSLINSDVESIDSLELILNTEDDLKWLQECPFKLETLYIGSIGGQLINDYQINPIFETSKLVATNFELDLHNLWQCYLLQNLILPNLHQENSLTIYFNETQLTSIVNENDKPLKKLNLTHEDKCIIYKLPELTHFTLICIEPRISSGNSNPNVSSTNSIRTLSASSSSSTKSFGSHQDYNNNSNMYAIDAALTGSMNYSISPSQFRRNSLAGLDDNTARRQSMITFDYPHSILTHTSQNNANKRRKSSLSSIGIAPSLLGPNTDIDEPFVDDVILFQLPLRGLKILSLNLNALESSLLSTRLMAAKIIPLLQIIVDDTTNLTNSVSIRKLLEEMVKEITKLVQYPYKLKLPGMAIDKLQFFIDLSGSIDIDFLDIDYLIFKAELETMLNRNDLQIIIQFESAMNTNFDISKLSKKSVLLKF